jgi:hypothetical protein
MRCLKPPPVGQPATRNRPSLFQTFDFEIQALPDLASTASAGSQQVACLFRRFSFDIPLLDAGHVHGRVERFSLGGFFSLDVFFNAATAMALTRGESLVGAILARVASPEQIDNETPTGYCKEFRERRSKTSPA